MLAAAPADTWPDHALCYGSDPRMWDTDDEGEPKKGRAICARCPVRGECLAAALAEENGKTFQQRGGIRGGLSPQQRAALAGMKRGRRVEPAKCRICDRPVRTPHARYCQEHRPVGADQQAVRDQERRATV